MSRSPTTSRTPSSDLVWDGHGCSISQASLSVMVDLVDGKTVDEAMELARHSISSWNRAGRSGRRAAEEKLDDAVVFQGVSKYPMRIKCALLGWEGHEGLRRQGMALAKQRTMRKDVQR